jgi:beta-mannosidase
MTKDSRASAASREAIVDDQTKWVRRISRHIQLHGIAVSFVVAFAVLWAYPCPAAAEPRIPEKIDAIDLNGTWEFFQSETPGIDLNQVPPDIWRRIGVPGNWFLEGHASSSTAWYRLRFDVPASVEKRVARLRFEGVDYRTEVWLNGHRLGSHEGSFQPFDYAVSGLLASDRSNLLLVRVDSPEEAADDWSWRKRLIKGIFGHHDTRPGGAWSWRGQEGNTGGIWGGVSLRFSDRAAIGAVRFTPKIEPDGRAGATVRIDVQSEWPVSFEADISVGLAPENHDGAPFPGMEKTIRITPGENRITIDLPPAAVRLWWPADLGQPALYRMTATVSSGGQALDRAEDSVGFRSIAYNPADGQLRINGRRLFLRGTNYISTQWLSEMTPARYSRDVRLMRDANINAVRVHAHLEAREFYRECDRAGLLVWQDFPLQWSYSDDEAFTAEAVRQTGDMIAMLYNAPSVFAWSLHNESPWDASWMKYKYPDYNPDQNRELDRRLLETALAADSSRYVHPYSATREHPWLGWYSGHWTDYAKPTDQPLITEFGAQALPATRTLERILGRPKPWPVTEADWAEWEYRNFQRRETFEIARVPQGRSIDEFVHNTQAYQARLTQLAAESYRRQRYRPVGAIFQFMLVEDWPSMNWGVLDYWRNPKLGYEALRTAYQPVLPSIEWDRASWRSGDPVEIGIWAINDLATAFTPVRIWFVVRRNGLPFAGQEAEIDLPGDSGSRVMAWNAGRLSPGSYEIDAAIRSADGSVLGRNNYRFTVDPPASPTPP